VGEVEYAFITKKKIGVKNVEVGVFVFMINKELGVKNVEVGVFVLME